MSQNQSNLTTENVMENHVNAPEYIPGEQWMSPIFEGLDESNMIPMDEFDPADLSRERTPPPSLSFSQASTIPPNDHQQELVLSEFDFGFGSYEQSGDEEANEEDGEEEIENEEDIPPNDVLNEFIENISTNFSQELEDSEDVIRETGSIEFAASLLTGWFVDHNHIPENDGEELFYSLIEILEGSIPEEFFEPVSIRLTKNTFDKIITTRSMGKKLLKQLGEKSVLCVICQETITSRKHCSVLGCKHAYHKNCAKTWFTEQCQLPTCPCCRVDVRTMKTFEQIQQKLDRKKNPRRSKRLSKKSIVQRW